MAKRKSTAKKKPRRKSRKNKLFNSSIAKAIGGLAILVVMVAVAGLLAHFLIPTEKPSKTDQPSKTVPQTQKPLAKIPPFEIYPPKDIPLEKPPIKKPPEDSKQLPLVAIIFDDLGYDKTFAQKLSQLNGGITFSILPHSPYRESIARLADEKGMDIMLHLPMEPFEYPQINPGPGTLLTTMTPDQLIRQLDKNLASVPHIKGVNNHMGSKMTAESSQLYQIFSILKKRNLYFIDSRTSSKTLCKPSARLFQIPFAQRDVFLDHFQDPDFIRKQIRELIRVAQLHGQAVGIGHPHTITYEVLREMMPELQKKVKLVPASEIVHPVG
ncbi:MAG: divergent polysaccharide deacetylase family protein [Desulfobacteraceae bacterium]|jgi:polysaccharide deacetylase 2 family uncharacterized protein YibQ|nr:divergent polysaccharide deacetylase family protein [Desulfobacteraceae bacterium]